MLSKRFSALEIRGLNSAVKIGSHGPNRVGTNSFAQQTVILHIRMRSKTGLVQRD